MNQNITMKDLPKSERPYERCAAFGAEMLTDAELLAVIIRTGSRQERSTELAAKVLQLEENGLLNLVYLTSEQLQQIPGIGPQKAIQLKCIAELSRRIARLTRKEMVILNDPSSIAAYFMEDMRHLRREHLMVALFDCKGRLIGSELLSVGTATMSVVSPAELFYQAIRFRADHVVLIHNHPSGDPTPSQEDLMITRQIRSAGELLGIYLADHIIIGDNCFYSFSKHGKE